MFQSAIICVDDEVAILASLKHSHCSTKITVDAQR